MRNSFVVQYLVSEWLIKKGLTGFFGGVLGWVAAWILGDLADLGILKLDLTFDQINEALRNEKWKVQAVEYYKKAGSRLFTEEEKNAIRNEYLDALDDYVGFGDNGRV